MLASVVGQLVLGWILADLVTGTFHWWEDRFGNENWPVLGSWLIAPNRLHHVDPLAFTEHGFLERNAASIVASTAIGLIWALISGPSVLLFVTVAGASISNEVHRYAHQPRAAGSIIRMLQQIGAMQSPKGHSAHHRPPQIANYCVLTDWLNPLLELLGFWSKLERLFGRTA